MAIKFWIGGASGATGDVSNAANWSPSGVPTTGDDVYFNAASSTHNVTAGLSGSGTLAGVVLASLHFLDTYTGLVGTSTLPLTVSATDVFIHEKTGEVTAAGSRRINLDLETSATTIRVYGSANNSADAALPPIRILAVNASNALYVSGDAKVGVAVGDASEVSTFTTINTSSDSANQSPALQVGEGCTLTTLEVGAGSLINRGANVTTAIVSGLYRVFGAATHTTLDVRAGGLARYSSTGTITTLKVARDATADFTGDSQAKTITNCTMYAGSRLQLDNGNPLSITITNGIDLVGCRLQDVAITTWSDVTVPNFTAI